MQNITHYVERKNTIAKLFSGAARRGALEQSLPMVSLDSAADRASLMLDIECDLSPENLTCDGEMPRAMVIKRAKYLNACMKELRALK